MEYTVHPGPRTGTAAVPPSKSELHRLLIAAALSDAPVRIALPDETDSLQCPAIAKDLEATAWCLAALGATVERIGGGFFVKPLPESALRTDGGPAFREGGAGRVLLCGDSASTLRFLLPVAGVLGIGASFVTGDSLSGRPLEPLAEALRKNGMTVERSGDAYLCGGRLTAGDYAIPGNVSSQFVSGLLLALPLLEGDSVLRVTGSVGSAGYIAMTERVLAAGGIRFDKTNDPYTYRIPGGQRFRLPETVAAERDWSAAAVFLAAGAASEHGVTVKGLDLLSSQGDRAILNVLLRFGAGVALREQLPPVPYAPHGGEAEAPLLRTALTDVTVRRGQLKGQTVDASAIPDLVPVIAAVAAAAEGETRIVRAERLRLKESDRLRTTAEMLDALGADVSGTADGLVIRGREKLRGGVVDSANDHRIAMAAAVAAVFCEGPVTIRGAESAAKSFPDFWEQLERLEAER